MTKLGKYELFELLGRGGFGMVYRARDTLLNVPRAIKLLHPALVADPEFIARFRTEAQIAARLEHPHIVPVYDLGELDGRFFLAMRLMTGGSLKDCLTKKGRLPFSEAVRITAQVAAALDFAYQQPERLVHRDVKPGNILLEVDGIARLSDFGFAKALEGAGSASLSTSGGLVGTLTYLAPEIWNSQPASPASDEYSLACVFIELLTGQSLFGGSDSPLPAIMKRHLDPLALPSLWPDGVPEGVDAVLSKALAKTPVERYVSAGEFARAMEEILKVSESPLTTSPSPLSKEGSSLTVDPSPVASEEAHTPRPTPAKGEKSDLTRGTLTGLMGQAPIGDEENTFTTRPQPLLSTPSPRGQADRPADRLHPWQTLVILGGLLLSIALFAGLLTANQGSVESRLTQTTLINMATTQAVQTIQAVLTESAPTLTRSPLPPSLIPSPLPASANSTPSLLSPTPSLGIGSTQASAVDGMVLSYIPAGTFLMGSNNGDADERPVHSVSLDAYWMDQTEVTNGMYAQCVAAGACSPPSSASFTHQSYFGNTTVANYPMTSVDWYQAAAYCTWAGRRLPTEAEWEYAARGGLAGVEYPWGNEDPVCTSGAVNGAQYSDCEDDTIAVGSFAPNGYGLFDMAGNVWEWVADWYGSYLAEPVENPAGPDSGSFRVLRNGAWFNNEYGLRSANRYRSGPDYADSGFGFRCACSP